LIKAWSGYYGNRISSVDLWSAILEYDLSDLESVTSAVSEIKRHWCFHVPNVSHIKSNGSTGLTNSTYQIGPNFDFWCPVVEQYLRNYRVLVRLVHGNRSTNGCYFERPFHAKNQLGQHCLFLDVANPSNVAQLGDFLKRLRDENSTGITLCAKPTTWLLLSTDEETLDMFRELDADSLVNEDWEPWVSERFLNSFRFNDQMIDWKTGLNFYTCHQGTKHFLPIFNLGEGACENLLNAARGKEPLSDLWVFEGEPEWCACGRPFRRFRYQSHHAHNPPIHRGVINDLRAGYVNLQYIVCNGVCNIMYSSLRQAERDILAGATDLPVVFREDQCVYIGDKKYNFWLADIIHVENHTWSGFRQLPFF